METPHFSCFLCRCAAAVVSRLITRNSSRRKSSSSFCDGHGRRILVRGRVWAMIPVDLGSWNEHTYMIHFKKGVSGCCAEGRAASRTTSHFPGISKATAQPRHALLQQQRRNSSSGATAASVCTACCAQSPPGNTAQFSQNPAHVVKPRPLTQHYTWYTAVLGQLTTGIPGDEMLLETPPRFQPNHVPKGNLVLLLHVSNRLFFFPEYFYCSPLVAGLFSRSRLRSTQGARSGHQGTQV